MLSGSVCYVVPILYKVDRMRDGHTFATRQVSAIQKGKVIFSMYSSYEVG
jgi:acyl-CoA thioesterase II